MDSSANDIEQEFINKAIMDSQERQHLKTKKRRPFPFGLLIVLLNSRVSTF